MVHIHVKIKIKNKTKIEIQIRRTHIERIFKKKKTKLSHHRVPEKMLH